MMQASPCVRNCCLDKDRICLGCFRHVDEICCWSQSSDAEQRRILQRAAVRRARRVRPVGA